MEQFVKASRVSIVTLWTGIFVWVAVVFSQESPKQSQYLLGTEEALEMVVHIWGEVRNPGEYRVPYETTVLELISKAGGPTMYAKLSKVRLTRESKSWYLTQDALKTIVAESRAGRITEDKLEESLKKHFANRIMEYDLTRYLEDREALTPPPTLQPGDVVYVPSSSWRAWREVVKVAHEIAIITSIYVWYLRSK